MNKLFTKWVAIWGNAMSITENKPESYAKNITLRYPIHCPFDADAIRLTLDNFCGTEDVKIEKTVIQIEEKNQIVTFNEKNSVCISAGKSVVSDEIKIDIKKGQTIKVSFYLKDFTQMRSSVYTQGCFSGGSYAIGDATEQAEFDINLSKKTNICYFLSDISVHTEEKNHAIICYGDSITAQDWPDILQQKIENTGIENVSIIRKATSGSRILREYSCITYESYGFMGKKRFEHEIKVDGADTIIIQQGINDIIHPVGTDVNIFRPMSDLPTIQELKDGMNWYIEKAKSFGYKIYLGTLLPIEGWRTYADFREILKNDFNNFMKNNKNVDGTIDFATAVQDSKNPKTFFKDYDSGDHLHPSRLGYEKMAEKALEQLGINN